MSPPHHASCPTAIVNAPIEVVWQLLTEPSRWGEFFDVRRVTVTPPGTASVGQVVRAESGPRLLRLKISFRFLEIEEQRRLLINVNLPLGIIVREDLNCAPFDKDQCRVNYGCNFEFPHGWRGVLARLFLHKEIDAGPADSLLRLKRRAEQLHANARA
jgi:hypothetical protein